MKSLTLLIILLNITSAAAAELERGTYFNFHSDWFKRFTAKSYSSTKYQLSFDLIYGNDYYSVESIVIDKKAPEVGDWYSREGNINVSYGGGLYHCAYKIRVVLDESGRSNKKFRFRVYAPQSIPSYYDRERCQLSKENSVWHTVSGSFVKEVKGTFWSPALNVDIPDGDKTGIDHTFQIPKLTPGNNYDWVKIWVNSRHPHYQDVLIKLTAPDGKVFNKAARFRTNDKQIFYKFKVGRYETFEGPWTVKVYDFSKGSKGKLQRIAIEFF